MSSFHDMRSILVIYTGGTIGMVKDKVSGALVPLDFSQVTRHVPELAYAGIRVEAVSFEDPIDSSDITPRHWRSLAITIQESMDRFDGFVVLHGTDTMAYSASALSFMLDGLRKPVIFTGSQLPIGIPRTDGRENLLSALMLAATRRMVYPPFRRLPCILAIVCIAAIARTSKVPKVFMHL